MKDGLLLLAWLLKKSGLLLEVLIEAAKRGEDPRTVVDVWKKNHADIARQQELEAAKADFGVDG